MGNFVTRQACCRASPNVRVVNPDGKVLVFKGEAVRVRDVLRSYPHHYVAEAGQEFKLTRRSMLKDEAVLKPGLTYSLQPLPRLFTVRDRRASSKHNAFTDLCVCIAAGGFTSSPSSIEDNMVDAHCHGEECSVGSLDSTFAMEFTSPRKTVTSPHKASRVPSALPPHLQELLKNAEIEWKEIQDINKTWRPDLDSIKEEPLPDRQTLAWLMRIESEMEEGGYDI